MLSTAASYTSKGPRVSRLACPLNLPKFRKITGSTIRMHNTFYLEAQRASYESTLERRSEPQHLLRDYNCEIAPVAYCWNSSKRTDWNSPVGKARRLWETQYHIFWIVLIQVIVLYHLQSRWPTQPHWAERHTRPIPPFRERIHWCGLFDKDGNIAKYHDRNSLI